MFRSPRRIRARRRTLLLVVLLFGGVLPATMAAGDATPARHPVSTSGSGLVAYWPPLPTVRVVHRFDPPAVRYGAGHLGVDLATSPGAVVRAAAGGVVRFAGSVAGRGVVVLQHPDGISTEYEPVRAVTGLARGDPVLRGAPIGVIAGSHHGCRPGRCLHWGAKRGDTYLDPLTLMVPLGPVRLLPWDPGG